MQDKFVQYIGNPWLVPFVPDNDMQGVRLNWDAQHGNFEFGDSFRADLGYTIFIRYESSQNMLIVCTAMAGEISKYLKEISNEPDKDDSARQAIIWVAEMMESEAARVDALNAAWRARGCPAHRIDTKAEGRA